MEKMVGPGLIGYKLDAIRSYKMIYFFLPIASNDPKESSFCLDLTASLLCNPRVYPVQWLPLFRQRSTFTWT
jgi:hypothetical protein